MTALFLLIALPWSPQSAWSLGDAHAFRIGTSFDLGVPLDRAGYDHISFGGQPTLAYHRGTDIGLELSFGAQFKAGLIYAGATPLVLGLKQTIVGNERVAFAASVAFAPFELSLDGNTLSVSPELVVSARLSEKWSMDIGAGVLVRPYWFTPLHDFGPLARVGFTVNIKRHALFFGINAGSQHTFHGPATPPPFPYVFHRHVNVGLYVGYAIR